jgi:hypothetical protein
MQLFEFGQDVLEVKDEFLTLLNLLLLHTLKLLDPKSVVNSLKRFLSLFNAYSVLQGAPDLFDISLAAAIVNAEIHNDLLVRVEQLLVKLGYNVHNVAGLEAQALAAGNKLIEVPARIFDTLLLICH